MNLANMRLGANQKEKLTGCGITHVLAIHDTAEAHWPEVGHFYIMINVSLLAVLIFLQDFTYKCIKVADNSSTDL